MRDDDEALKERCAQFWGCLTCIFFLAWIILPSGLDYDRRVDDGLFPFGFVSAEPGSVALQLMVITMLGGWLFLVCSAIALNEDGFHRLRFVAYNLGWIFIVCSISYGTREEGAIVMVENPCECLNVSISDGFRFCYLSNSSLSFETEQLDLLDSVVEWVGSRKYGGRERFVPEITGSYRYVEEGTLLEVGLYGGDSVICPESEPVLYLRAVDEEGARDSSNKWMIRGRESLEDTLDGLNTYLSSELTLTNDQVQRLEAASEVVVIGGDSPGEGDLAYWVKTAQYLYGRRSEREKYNLRMELMDKDWYVALIVGIYMYPIPYFASKCNNLFPNERRLMRTDSTYDAPSPSPAESIEWHLERGRRFLGQGALEGALRNLKRARRKADALTECPLELKARVEWYYGKALVKDDSNNPIPGIEAMERAVDLFQQANCDVTRYERRLRRLRNLRKDLSVTMTEDSPGPVSGLLGSGDEITIHVESSAPAPPPFSEEDLNPLPGAESINDDLLPPPFSEEDPNPPSGGEGINDDPPPDPFFEEDPNPPPGAESINDDPPPSLFSEEDPNPTAGAEGINDDLLPPPFFEEDLNPPTGAESINDEPPPSPLSEEDPNSPPGAEGINDAPPPSPFSEEDPNSPPGAEGINDDLLPPPFSEEDPNSPLGAEGINDAPPPAYPNRE